MSVIKKLLGNKAPKVPPCAAVIVAAGSSARMGFDKITVDLGGEPAIARTIGAFEACGYIREIVVVTRDKSVADIARICKEFGFNKVTKVLRGGETRLASALTGACEVSENAKYIAIHDGARPLVTVELIERTVEAAVKDLAAAPAITPADTVKLVDKNGYITRTLPRENVVLIQTPQVFESSIIKGALTRAFEQNNAFTDDCAAAEAIGISVMTVPGDPDNIKLTTPSDIFTAQRILTQRGEMR